MIDELVTTALLGTRGTAARMPPLPADLAAALPTDGQDDESRLLDAGAAATLYCRAGAKPRTDIARPEPCPPDRCRECSPQAADLLAQSFDEGLQPLLLEWLTLAEAKERRPPHRLLPKLLETAARKRALQAAVAAVIDERGRWLMQFDSQWQFASPSAIRRRRCGTWAIGSSAARRCERSAKIMPTGRASWSPRRGRTIRPSNAPIGWAVCSSG